MNLCMYAAGHWIDYSVGDHFQRGDHFQCSDQQWNAVAVLLQMSLLMYQMQSHISQFSYVTLYVP